MLQMIKLRGYKGPLRDGTHCEFYIDINKINVIEKLDRLAPEHTKLCDDGYVGFVYVVNFDLPYYLDKENYDKLLRTIDNLEPIL